MIVLTVEGTANAEKASEAHLIDVAEIGAALGSGDIELGNEIWTAHVATHTDRCLLYTSPSPRDRQKSRMPSSA